MWFHSLSSSFPTLTHSPLCTYSRSFFGTIGGCCVMSPLNISVCICFLTTGIFSHIQFLPSTDWLNNVLCSVFSLQCSSRLRLPSIIESGTFPRTFSVFHTVLETAVSLLSPPKKKKKRTRMFLVLSLSALFSPVSECARLWLNAIYLRLTCVAGVAVRHLSLVPNPVPVCPSPAIYCMLRDSWVFPVFWYCGQCCREYPSMSVGALVRVSLRCVQHGCCWGVNHVNSWLFKIIPNWFPKWMWPLILH